jgi:hypothetical protein
LARDGLLLSVSIADINLVPRALIQRLRINNVSCRASIARPGRGWKA